MNEENESAFVPANDGDMDTTPPNPATAAPPAPNQGKQWEMPKPVFRRSSGRLPQSFAAEAAPASVGEADPAGPPSPDTSAYVEPQPDISEELVVDSPVDTLDEPRERSTAVRIFLLIGVLLVIAGFVAIFLSVIYFLFLAPAAENTL